MNELKLKLMIDQLSVQLSKQGSFIIGRNSRIDDSIDQFIDSLLIYIIAANDDSRVPLSRFVIKIGLDFMHY